LTKIQRIKERLEQGFFIDNLNEMIHLCDEMALGSKKPAPLFILKKILWGVVNYWDQVPVTVEDGKLVEGELKKHIKNLLDAIESDMPAEKVLDRMNEVVSSYLFLFNKSLD